MAEDAPGVLAQVAAVLGRHRISIRSVLQHEPLAAAEAAGVPVVITTHQAVEGNVRAALARGGRPGRDQGAQRVHRHRGRVPRAAVTPPRWC